MNWIIRVAFFCVPVFLTVACWIDNAKAYKENKLHIFAQKFTSTDSLIIEKFSKKYKVKIFLHRQEETKTTEMLFSKPFEPRIDIMFFANDSCLNRLLKADKFKRIDFKLLKNTDRAFDMKSNACLPLYFDPLVISMLKDTSGICKTTKNMRSLFQKDSLRPTMYLNDKTKRILSASKQLNFLLKDGKPSRKVLEIRLLSELVVLSKTDGNYFNYCHYYWFEHKKMLGNKRCITQFKHARNGAVAQKFMEFYYSQLYQIADEVNAIPCSKKVSSNFWISKLNVSN